MSQQQLKVEFPSHERPNTDVSAMMLFFVAFVFVALIMGPAYLAKGTFYRDLLMGRNEIFIERIIFQGATVLMFSLSLSNIFLKFMKIRGEAKAMKKDLLPPDLNITDVPSLIKIYESILANPSVKKSVGVTRTARVLAMWINTGDFERTSQYAKQENEMDIFVSDSTYKMNRMFIWAMPLLGFVGTVYGVSYGIGGFAEFLKGQVTAEGIKDQIGLITLGLAVAFYCTLLGLVTAGIAAFPGLAAERKEEGILEEIDQYVEDRLVSRMPSVHKTEFPVEHIVAMRQGIENMKVSVKFPTEELAEMMKSVTTQQFPMEELAKVMQSMTVNFPTSDLTAAIENGFKRMPDPDRYEKVFSQAVSSASDSVREKYEEFAKIYEHRIDELGNQLSSKLDVVASNFHDGTQKVSQEISGHAQQVGLLNEKQAEQFALAQQKYMTEHTEMAQKELGRWEQMVTDFRDMAGQMASQLSTAVGSMNEAADHYSQRVEGSTRALVDQIGKVVEIGVRIDELLQATQAMEHAFVKLGTSEELGETLSSLRTHLATSDELVKKITKPRTIVLEESRS
jgi:hypothetical protein